MTTTPAQPEPSEREALALPPGWEYEDGCWMVAVTLLADNGPARVRVNGEPVWQGHVDETSGALVDDRPISARPAPVVSAEDDQAAAVKADERMGGYGYRHSPAWRYAYLAALGITVADTPAADDEGGQGR